MIKHLLSNFDRHQVTRHMLFAICVGIAGAIGSIILCICLNSANYLSQNYFWLIFFLPIFGLISIFLYKKFKLNPYLATNDVIDKIRDNKKITSTLAPGILIGSFLSVLGGGSVGKESAALQMGASIGETLGKPFKLKAVRKNKQEDYQHGYAASTGMAATFSALFFSPIGSTFFVWELSRFKKSVTHHFPSILVSCFIASAIAHIVGIGDIIPKVDIPDFSIHILFISMLVAILCGVGGAIFGTVLRKLQRFTKQVIKNPYIAILIGGIIIVILVNCFDWKIFEGTGENLIALGLSGDANTYDFLIKALLTILALGFCFKGGEIMPMFTIGALLGCTIGIIVGIPVGFSAMIGLVTFFAGATRCPLAAFFIGIETFGLNSLPYLLIGVICAYVASFDFGFYGHGVVRETKESIFSHPYLQKKLQFLHTTHTTEIPYNKDDEEPFEAAVDPRRFMTEKQRTLLAKANREQENKTFQINKKSDNSDKP